MTIQGLINDWNSNISEMETVVTQANEEIMQKINDGTMSLEAGVTAWNPLPKKLAMPGGRWARWFLKEWGWSFLSRNSDTQTWLPYNHPDMESMRQRIKTLIETSTELWSVMEKLLSMERHPAVQEPKAQVQAGSEAKGS